MTATESASMVPQQQVQHPLQPQPHPQQVMQNSVTTTPSTTDPTFVGPTIQNAYGEFLQIAGYTIQQTLGSGSFATVLKGIKNQSLSTTTNANTESTTDDTSSSTTNTTTTIAIKAINRNSEKITKKVLQNLELEISILQTYKHPNIVCCTNVHKTDKHIFLFLEYCAGGDLQRLIRTRKNRRLSERLARRLMRDLTAGLTFLARHQLIHRDIKPQNLLLTGILPLDEVNDPADNITLEEERKVANFPSELFHLKIADFGFARHLQKTSMADTLCGSPLYMAPEILQHRSYDNKADLWSAGTVLFEMIAGRPPFQGENHIDLLRNIQQKAVRLPPDLTVSKECVKLLRILLNRNPISRAGFKDFIEVSNAFVALGCNGTNAASDSVNTITSSYNNNFDAGLGPISEEETNHPSSSTLMTSQQQSVHMNFDHSTALQNPIRRNFSPLEPSPPGPRALVQSKEDFNPPPLQLGNYNNDQRYFQQCPSSNMVSQRSGKSEFSQNSDDGEFVMVEKSIATALSTSPRLTMWKRSNSNPPSTPVSPRSNSSRFFSNKTILSSRNLIPPVIPFVNKGMLSTSPGTGGALVGMMGNPTTKDNAIVADRGDNGSSFVMPHNGVFNYELFARMLAAAEDVGRRAIHVAHVGDTRAYLAMKLIMANENFSSVYSTASPMEGVVEESITEDEEYCGESNSFSTRSRAVSTDQTHLNHDDDDDDEMPFAMPSPVEDSNPIDTKGINNGRLSSDITNVIATPKKTGKISNWAIEIHFREALSCYIKSLTMLKGSVNASQRIISELKSFSTSSMSNEIMESMNQFQKRCDASNNWLVGQFKGVLERAEAGKSEISKLSSTNSKYDEKRQTESNISLSPVEELIYNHSLACGRDGAVKQLLGQYEASRACYRSAGLLIETLLMEQKLVDEDKQALESYVQGFAERINELDCIMLHENKQNSMVASSTLSTRGSSVIPVISGGHIHVQPTKSLIP